MSDVFTEAQDAAFSGEVQTIFHEESATVFLPTVPGKAMTSQRTYKVGFSINVPMGQTYEDTIKWCRLQSGRYLQYRVSGAMAGHSKEILYDKNNI